MSDLPGLGSCIPNPSRESGPGDATITVREAGKGRSKENAASRRRQRISRGFSMLGGSGSQG